MLSATPSLLIIVPTLDSYRLLPRLLNSLQNQTWQNWTILFIDGPSGSDHRRWLESCCKSESRSSWIIQDPADSGIFGAMNQGFAQASPDDCLLFWGSDDWAAGPNVLGDAIAALQASSRWPDLLVCRGRYADARSLVLSRQTLFHPAGLLSASAYRRALCLGLTPPHQATIFCPGARQRLSCYASGYNLSADLNYFLQLSRSSNLSVQCLDLELVHMADDGVSGQQTQLRLQEVHRAYRSSFGWLWWFPFLMRYLRRVASLLERSR